MIYGYCRISTEQQNLDRQERNIIAAFPEAKNHMFREAFTGTKIDRPQWNKLYSRLQTNDTIVFDSVSRMSRNADDGVELYMQLFDRNIELVFLKEPHINTSTYRAALQSNVALVGDEIADIYITATNKALKVLAEKQIRIAFEEAEKEVQDLRQRTREGIVTARLNGKHIGGFQGRKLNVKKEAPAKEIILKHSKDFGGTLNDIECAKVAEISKNTFYKYKAELKKSLENEVGSGTNHNPL